MDQFIRQPDGTWHREVERQCWTRTEPGPVRVFTGLPEAEAYARQFRPIMLQGRGQTATEPIRLPAAVSVATFTHDGRSNFIVHGFHGTEDDLLVNTIGPYRGARPLVSEDPVTLDIRADGAWTVRVEAIVVGGTAPFTGRGDAVSTLFDPPAQGSWEITHYGTRNFIVWLQCAGGSVLVQNEIGPVNGSRVVQFRRGPCYWDVRADGNWSLRPRG
jgi:hypothetical protein